MDVSLGYAIVRSMFLGKLGLGFRLILPEFGKEKRKPDSRGFPRLVSSRLVKFGRVYTSLVVCWR